MNLNQLKPQFHTIATFFVNPLFVSVQKFNYIFYP